MLPCMFDCWVDLLQINHEGTPLNFERQQTQSTVQRYCYLGRALRVQHLKRPQHKQATNLTLDPACVRRFEQCLANWPNACALQGLSNSHDGDDEVIKLGEKEYCFSTIRHTVSKKYETVCIIQTFTVEQGRGEGDWGVATCYRPSSIRSSRICQPLLCAGYEAPDNSENYSMTYPGTVSHS